MKQLYQVKVKVSVNGEKAVREIYLVRDVSVAGAEVKMNMFFANETGLEFEITEIKKTDILKVLGGYDVPGKINEELDLT